MSAASKAPGPSSGASAADKPRSTKAPRRQHSWGLYASRGLGQAARRFRRAVGGHERLSRRRGNITGVKRGAGLRQTRDADFGASPTRQALAASTPKRQPADGEAGRGLSARAADQTAHCTPAEASTYGCAPDPLQGTLSRRLYRRQPGHEATTHRSSQSIGKGVGGVSGEGTFTGNDLSDPLSSHTDVLCQTVLCQLERLQEFFLKHFARGTQGERHACQSPSEQCHSGQIRTRCRRGALSFNVKLRDAPLAACPSGAQC